MGVRRTDPIEKRRLALMRQAAGKTQKFNLGGQIKKGGHAPRPITLAGEKSTMTIDDIKRGKEWIDGSR